MTILAPAVRSRPSRRSSTEVLVSLLSADDRRRLESALASVGLAATFTSAAEPLAGVDRRTLMLADAATLQPSMLRGDRPVAAVGRNPAPSERLRLLAAGVADVIDLAESEDRIAARIQALADPASAGLAGRWPHSRAPAMRTLLDQAAQLAQSDASVLITGETGVGKEHLARAIHAAGPRAGKPFVVVNCGALPESLLESQLFGHERGAFTGADRQHRGFFEEADGGTLLLDEIGEMPPHLQVKLLTVLESREVMRIGASRPVQVDVRVMAATNRDIERVVAEGRFREDLYYRLNVIRLEVPALRARLEDLPDLAGRLLADLVERPAVGDFAGVTPAALDVLAAHAWPGNVRELRNVLERALVLGGADRIDVDHLPAEVRAPRSAPSGTDWLRPGIAPEWDGLTLREVREAAVASVERAYLCRVLELTKGRVGKTAERAGLKPRSLYDKMRLYDLRKEDFKRR